VKGNERTGNAALGFVPFWGGAERSRGMEGQ
jgi:hypothetical protein